MTIHPSKSTDTRPVLLDKVTIAATKSYMYLGTTILNAPIKKQVQHHIDTTSSHLHKFTSFLKKNNEAPLDVKKRVCDSAVSSAIFYSCETWLANDIRATEKPYLTMMKQILGVRDQTPTNIVLLELGLPNATSIIRNRQCKYLKKLQRRSNYEDSYMKKVIDLSISVSSPMGEQIKLLMENDIDHETACLLKMKRIVKCAEATRVKAYLAAYPELVVHPMYSSRPTIIPEWARVEFTRLRLGSHRLRVETGRWSRIPRDQTYEKNTHGY